MSAALGEAASGGCKLMSARAASIGPPKPWAAGGGEGRAGLCSAWGTCRNQGPAPPARKEERKSAFLSCRGGAPQPVHPLAKGLALIERLCYINLPSAPWESKRKQAK